jgi:hypothetical protein
LIKLLQYLPEVEDDRVFNHAAKKCISRCKLIFSAGDLPFDAQLPVRNFVIAYLWNRAMVSDKEQLFACEESFNFLSAVGQSICP